jgi:hypothetical protein
VHRTANRLLGIALVVVSFGIAPLWGQGGHLKVKIKPGRAGIFVDGKYVGPAANYGLARKYAVSAGEHEVRVVDPRYEEWTTKVTVEAGKTAEINQSLKALPAAMPPFGKLRVIAANKFAAVYINGKYYGHSGEIDGCSQALLLNPGSYEVRVEGGGQPHTETVAIVAGKTAKVRAGR